MTLYYMNPLLLVLYLPPLIKPEHLVTIQFLDPLNLDDLLSPQHPHPLSLSPLSPHLSPSPQA